ncbi:sulfite exporter TauE/SafE family protein [Pseudomonas stutzeri]|nr:sulfite exporter TauE/SafE family protein [Stutzerimonas stutzeri]MCQ4252018.1 sulfite exporter TauE/SafE family protein [Stutzerimonas stutzeri]
MTLSEFLLFALPAIFLTGLSKGGFGGALGGIAVPLLALAISPKQAAAVMLPILCLADVVGLKAYIGHWDKANLKVMMPGALIGIALGTLTFGMLDERLIGLLMGAIAVGFVYSGSSTATTSHDLCSAGVASCCRRSQASPASWPTPAGRRS